MPSITLSPTNGYRATSATPTFSCNDTLVGLDSGPSTGTVLTSSNNNNNNNNSSSCPWRPDSARSSPSVRSASPLFSRLSRARHHHRDRRTGSAETAVVPATTEGRASSSGHHSYNPSTHSRRASLSSGPPPPLTREEFEALPVAIQRKYFSTLERLRFAQGSGIVDGIYQHYDAISAQHFRRRRSRQDRSASENFSGRLRRRALRESASFSTNNDSLIYANLPDKIKKRQFTREEQVLLAGQLRASVILDAADEAIYRLGRRRGTHLVPLSIAKNAVSSETSMETESMQTSLQSPVDVEKKSPTGVPDSFYDSFRWLEEEDDLDLRLFLDDYHANLRENILSPPKQPNQQVRRPSFRRHLSISKLPFSRPSVSYSRPATNDASSPITPGSATTSFPIMPNTSHSSPPPAFPHTRRKSRALSLINPRHAPHESVSSIDPDAAHYQDPEARLKLRVYLASPQKFDEAIEFGFPSSDVMPAPGPLDSIVPNKRRHVRQSTADNTDALGTFLADDDDDEKLDSDLASIPDPESPKTPKLLETGSSQGGKPPGMRPYRMSSEPVSSRRPSESYAQVPVSSREMTLRMTLTRPDLRACEDQIYGWQQSPSQSQTQPYLSAQPVQLVSGRKSQSLLRDDMMGGSAGSRHKESIENVFAGIDHWGPDAPEKGMVKRLWNRMRRS